MRANGGGRTGGWAGWDLGLGKAAEIPSSPAARLLPSTAGSVRWLAHLSSPTPPTQARHWTAVAPWALAGWLAGRRVPHCRRCGDLMQLTCALMVVMPNPAVREKSTPRSLPLIRSNASNRQICPPQTDVLILDRLHAVPTRVQAAVPAFPDEPEGPGVADVAGPLDQRVVRLDHDE